MYYTYELKSKLNYLTEYYKYHNEIVRIYMLPLSRVYYSYHNEKRKCNYNRIK